MSGCNGMIIGLEHDPEVIEADSEEEKMRSSHRVLILSSKSEQIFFDDGDITVNDAVLLSMTCAY